VFAFERNHDCRVITIRRILGGIKVLDYAGILNPDCESMRVLPAVDYRRLFPRLEAPNLPSAATLFEPAAPIEFAYLPTDSTVTLSYTVE
jgi:hypothetical protein